MIDRADDGLAARVREEIGVPAIVTDTVMRDDEVAEQVARTALAALS